MVDTSMADTVLYENVLIISLGEYIGTLSMLTLVLATVFGRT